MPKILENKEIIAKGYTLNLIWTITIFTVVPYFMYRKLYKELFQWEIFNPNGIATLIFLILSFIGILSWIKLFDKKPFLIINKKGIWIRKSILPFSSLQYIDWNQINYVVLKTIKQAENNETTVLDIYRKDVSAMKRIDLKSLDYSSEEIISLVREYSKLLNYRDRIEVKNNG